MTNAEGPPGADARTVQAVRRYLRAGARSAHELRAFLRKRGVPESAVRSLVASSAKLGWVDDEACAKLCALHWANQGYATDAIRTRLLGKGLDPSIVFRILLRLHLAGDDEPRARALVQRQRRATSSRQQTARRPRQTHRHLVGLLARRGFDQDLIERVLGQPSEPADDWRV
jgi:regulatory protein